MRNIIANISAILVISLWASTTSAQSSDSTKTNTNRHELHLKQPESVIAPPALMNYVPYYFNPKQVSVTLNYYSIVKSNTSELIAKSRSTDVPLQSIQYSLDNARREAEKYKVWGYIGIAGGIGGMIYQIANGERLAKEAQQRREARSKPPVRR